jgi:hypothetical protein
MRSEHDFYDSEGDMVEIAIAEFRRKVLDYWSESKVQIAYRRMGFESFFMPEKSRLEELE